MGFTPLMAYSSTCYHGQTLFLHLVRARATIRNRQGNLSRTSAFSLTATSHILNINSIGFQ
ncbi:hypothetical protein KP509_19G023200 [Ceratopteris richardii]|uniref:Uncharacterized protein n=1 Tax=Ceratopteris richardii TaxID=49495 RepID=A0A8T2SM91_CERRI|nr:hypothetical protein KP509_19G023200 [Ceratopteris richardii]